MILMHSLLQVLNRAIRVLNKLLVLEENMTSISNYNTLVESNFRKLIIQKTKSQVRTMDMEDLQENQ